MLAGDTRREVALPYLDLSGIEQNFSKYPSCHRPKSKGLKMSANQKADINVRAGETLS